MLYEVITSRYLPDRRDLNRSFPGKERGSLAAQVAHLFMTEIVAKCTHGIDLHTGSNHRTNIPQVRGDLRNREVRRCAEACAVRSMRSRFMTTAIITTTRYMR